MAKFVISRDRSLVAGSKVLDLYCQFLEVINTPVALGVYLQLRAGEFDAVAARRIEPRNYTDWKAFRNDYQAVSGLRKADFLRTTVNRREAATVKFWDSEKKCRDTNERFRALADLDPAALMALEMDHAWEFTRLEKARLLIRTILSDRLPTSLDYRFGPGVTSLVKRGVTLPKKYASSVDVTPELYGYWRDITGPRWASHVRNVDVVAGSSISFVPKDATTDRTIAVEPHINIYAQLGVGGALRRRFRKWVDLDNGQDFNRFLASHAQEWRLATTDLSSASDTIARELVRYLLPGNWWELMETVRSHRFTLNGLEHRFEKFSSMGNGFTFELESIIFYALARATGSHPKLTTVYGDDIITESRCAEDLHRLLAFCGFEVNRNKSYSDGSFYESCGEDYFDGKPVRPFFLKKLGPQTVFQFANQVRRWSGSQIGRYRFSDARFKRVWVRILLSAPDEARECLVPSELGDAGFWVEWDEAAPSLRLPRERQGKTVFSGENATMEMWSTKALRHRPTYRLYRGDPRGYLAALDTESEQSRAPERGSGVYEICRANCSKQWHGPGPWV